MASKYYDIDDILTEEEVKLLLLLLLIFSFVKSNNLFVCLVWFTLQFAPVLFHKPANRVTIDPSAETNYVSLLF